LTISAPNGPPPNSGKNHYLARLNHPSRSTPWKYFTGDYALGKASYWLGKLGLLARPSVLAGKFLGCLGQREHGVPAAVVAIARKQITFGSGAFGTLYARWMAPQDAADDA
jgi:hypothetical protein